MTDLQLLFAKVRGTPPCRSPHPSPLPAAAGKDVRVIHKPDPGGTRRLAVLILF